MFRRLLLPLVLLLPATSHGHVCVPEGGWAEATKRRFETAEYVLLVEVGPVERRPSSRPEFETELSARLKVLEVLKGRVSPRSVLEFTLGQPDKAFAWRGDVLLVYSQDLIVSNDDFGGSTCEPRTRVVRLDDPELEELRRLVGARNES